ncbi:MAG: hypothetical protein HY711_05045 [Candidatus Melainabacteria bacterium]|nr:hypothetical protein [Candidatus Melainabacteria bacterium]
MAKLCSEDNECISSLELARLESLVMPKTQEEQCWQAVALTLKCGSWQLGFSGADNVSLVCPISRYPTDEIDLLIKMLSCLAGGTKETIIFEPYEPAFELVIERTVEGGIKVHAWLDSGNTATGIYRWDAVGIRFYTTQHLLLSFIAELKRDFISAAPNSN